MSKKPKTPKGKCKSGRKEDKWDEKRAEEQGETRETAKKARTTTKKARKRGKKCVFPFKFWFFFENLVFFFSPKKNQILALPQKKTKKTKKKTKKKGM